MRDFFITAMHVFVIVVVGGFVILGNMALAGKFDHWDSRFIKKAQHVFNRLRRYFDRKHTRQQDENINVRREHHAHHETHTNDNQTIE